MKRSFTLIGCILAIISLTFLSFWFYKLAYQIEGPTRIISGPQNTIYVLVDDDIVKLSPDGEVLKTFSLSGTMGINELVADFYVDPNDDILVGLKHSQIIKHFSPEGRLKRVHSRLPSPLVNDDRNFKFTKDPATGILYVADSVHHRIQIYCADEKEIRTLQSPSSKIQDKPTENLIDEEGEGEGFIYQNDDPNKPFLFPNVLAIDGDRLYITDTDNWRIAIFHLDGTFDRLIPLVKSGDRDFLPFPVRFSRMGSTLFVIKRGTGFVGGEVVTVDLATGEKKPVQINEKIDPQDVLARQGDVLISDRETKSILRISPSGELLGTCGKSSFNDILAMSRLKQRMYLWLSKGSLWGILGIFIILVFLAVKDFITHKRLGPDSESKPIAYLQQALGPVGSRRRRVLLVMIPGIGQLAAGRVVQAVIFPLPLAVFLFVFLYSMTEIFRGTISAFPMVMTSGLIATGLWAAIVINGIRLNKPGVVQPRHFSIKDAARTAASPVLTVALGALFQHLWDEFVNRQNPEVSIAIQGFFREIMIKLGLESSHTVVFAAMTPVNMFFAWGGAVAGLFATTAWRFRLGKAKIVWAALVGHFSGMLSWSITATFVGTILGGGFFMPLAQGALVSFAVYLFFHRQGMSPLIIPLAMAGAWIGDMVVIFVPGLWFIGGRNPGEYTRIISVIGIAYFIHLAILMIMNATNRKAKEMQPIQAERTETV